MSTWIIFSKKINLCLNVGPIKVFRWPEVHIPVYLQQYYTSNIDGSTELSKRALGYIGSLLSLLQREYGKDLLNTTFQLENEAFNRFGHLRAKLSQEYVYSAISILKKEFPNSKLMLNSAGRTNLREILKLFDIITKKNLYTYDSLILGINYYFKIPHTQPFLKVLDPMKISYPFDMSVGDLSKEISKKGFNIEISEGQFEPWGEQNTPGNSFDDFRYLLEKSRQVLGLNDSKNILRLWGVEEFSARFLNGTANDQHQMIAKSIRSINGV